MLRERFKVSFHNRQRERIGVGLTVAVVVVGLMGCAKSEPAGVSVVPVKGTITFKGQPMPGAIVGLHPKTPLGENVPTPRASVTKDGTFEVSTYRGGDGAPEGEYVLTVQWYKPIKNGSDVVAGPNVIPPKYSRPETSDKIIKIAAGVNQLEPIKL
jgi:hypothetical protein